LTGDLVFPLAMLIACLAFVPANLANCCGVQGTQSNNPAV
jgi:hypothetical protein